MAKKNNENVELNDVETVEAAVEETVTEKLSQEETDAIMAKFDRESATRIFEGKAAVAAKVLLIAFAIFGLYINISHVFVVQLHRTTFLAAVLFVAYVLYPYSKKAPKDLKSTKSKVLFAIDICLGLASVACFLYFAVNFEAIVMAQGKYSTTDIFVGICGIILLMEACRRVVGLPILIVVLCAISYAAFGENLSGTFSHRGFTYTRIVSHLFYTTEGIIGTPLGVCSTFIFLFILFGAFLEKTGVGQFFIDISNSIAGWATGGPAKVAVISSALQGTISGSSVANTVSSGSFTIPMMKRMGYKPNFAGAVEAAASTGGQIMPPIMGAAAFLMSEMTGVPYSSIIMAAIIPAFLYFAGVMLTVHLEAKKLGLKGMPKEEIPHFGRLFMGGWYLLMPLVILVYMLMNGSTASTAALYAIGAAIIVSLFKKSTRITPKGILEALENGAKNIIGVAIACAMSGMIVGVVTLTGVGLKLATGLLEIAGGNIFIALFFTMISSIVLGMGVPTTANYVIMATITAPVVLQMGQTLYEAGTLAEPIPVLAAHMFVFYFGIVADITPPVALAAYAGSAIAKGNPLLTGCNATKLGIAAFLIPYIFVLNPAMLLIDTNALEVAQTVGTSLMGMLGISCCMEGYLFRNMNPIERIIALAGGLTLIVPGTMTDVIGFGLLILIIGEQVITKNKNKKAEVA